MPKVVFQGEGLEVEVEPGTSILEAAEECGAQVGSSCGGVCACSTCHVYVKEGEDSLSEMEEDEDDRLDMGFDVRSESRLGCQARLVGEETVIVEITHESRSAYFDEHPEERRKAQA